MRTPMTSYLFKQSCSSEIAIGADYERNENYVHASGAFSVPQQRVFPTAIRRLPEAFVLTVSKSRYPNLNTRANLDYVGKIPDIS